MIYPSRYLADSSRMIAQRNFNARETLIRIFAHRIYIQALIVQASRDERADEFRPYLCM